VRQLPYAPDIPPCHVFLFYILKKELKGKIFNDVERNEYNASGQLSAIPETEFEKCFQALAGTAKQVCVC
jgi:hypothetical protein